MGTHPIFESDFDCLTDDLKSDLKTMIEFEYKKFEFWVIPIFILICLVNDTLNKLATILIVLIVLAIQFNNNHFGNQRTFRINRRILRKSRRRNMVRTVPPKHRTVSDSNN